MLVPDKTKDLHRCESGDLAVRDHMGPIIVVCREQNNGRLWVEGKGYAARVDKCPFCGFKARTPVPYGCIH
ncbi:MAG: hypothetical protein K0U84_13550 [Actinomycetia bacterium]|nr:hypothetical protein [Actinomycetes bacterium]